MNNRAAPELDDGRKFSGIGSFLIGEVKKDYPILQEERKARNEKRSNISRDKAGEGSKGWYSSR